MCDSSRIVRLRNSKVLHEPKNIIIKTLEVQHNIIVNGTWETELQKWHKVLVVRTEREFGHKLDKLTKIRKDRLGIVFCCDPSLQALPVIQIQYVGFQPVREYLPVSDVERALQLVPVATQQSLHWVTHYGKFEVVLELVDSLFSGQASKRMHLIRI